jgi:hypothetical protein
MAIQNINELYDKLSANENFSEFNFGSADDFKLYLEELPEQKKEKFYNAWLEDEDISKDQFENLVKKKETGRTGILSSALGSIDFASPSVSKSEPQAIAPEVQAPEATAIEDVTAPLEPLGYGKSFGGTPSGPKPGPTFKWENYLSDFQKKYPNELKPQDYATGAFYDKIYKKEGERLKTEFNIQSAKQLEQFSKGEPITAPTFVEDKLKTGIEKAREESLRIGAQKERGFFEPKEKEKKAIPTKLDVEEQRVFTDNPIVQYNIDPVAIAEGREFVDRRKAKALEDYNKEVAELKADKKSIYSQIPFYDFQDENGNTMALDEISIGSSLFNNKPITLFVKEGKMAANVGVPGFRNGRLDEQSFKNHLLSLGFGEETAEQEISRLKQVYIEDLGKQRMDYLKNSFYSMSGDNPEMANARYLEYYNNKAIDLLSDDEKEGYNLSKHIDALYDKLDKESKAPGALGAKNDKIESIKRTINVLQNQLNQIRENPNNLYDWRTGEFVNKSIKNAPRFAQIQQENKEFQIKYGKEPKNVLVEKRDKLIQQREEILNLMKQDGLEIPEKGTFASAVKAMQISAARTAGTGQIRLPDGSYTNAARYEKKMDEYNKQLFNVERELYGINRAVMLNEDVALRNKVETGIVESGVKFFAEAGKSIGRTITPGSVSEDAKSDWEIRNSLFPTLEKSGFIIEPKLKSAARKDVSEMISDSAGTLLEAMVGIAAGNALLPAVKTMKWANKFKDILSKKYGKIGESLFDSTADMIRSGVIFETAGQGFATGVGEQAGQVAFDALDLDKFFGNKGRFLEYFARVLTGGGAETVQEYAGQYLQTLADQGIDIEKNFKTAFGRDSESALDQFLQIAITSALFSGASNAKILLATRTRLNDVLTKPGVASQYGVILDEDTRKEVEEVLNVVDDKLNDKSTVQTTEKKTKEISEDYIPEPVSTATVEPAAEMEAPEGVTPAAAEVIPGEEGVGPIEATPEAVGPQTEADIEAKKADIEQRRQKELEDTGVADIDKETIEEKTLREITALFEKYKDSKDSGIEFYVAEQKRTGALDDRAYATLANKYFEELSDDVRNYLEFKAPAIDFETPEGYSPYYKGFGYNRDEATGHTPQVHGGHISLLKENISQDNLEKANKQDLAEDINAKYDAELTALEQKPTEAVGPQPKTNLQEISTEVAQGGVTDVSLQKIEDYGKEIESGNVDFERFSPAEQRGLIEGGPIHVEATIITGKSDRGTDTQDESNDRQEEIVEEYAKKKGIWTENAHAKLNQQHGKPINSGQESIVWLDRKRGVVIKSSNTRNYTTLREALDSITLSNAYFPAAKITVIGFGTDAEGNFEIITEQPYIQGTEATEQEIKDYFNNLGFTENERLYVGKDAFGNEEVIFKDAAPKNVIKTPEGNIIPIDLIAKINKPELNANGTRIVPSTVAEEVAPAEVTPTEVTPTEAAPEAVGPQAQTTAEISKPKTFKEFEQKANSIAQEKENIDFTKDSVVKDGNQNPIVVYNNTNETETRFGEEKPTGLFFTTNPQTFSEYGKNKYAAVLNIKNPYYASQPEVRREVDIKKLKEAGYDGIITHPKYKYDRYVPVSEDVEGAQKEYIENQRKYDNVKGKDNRNELNMSEAYEVVAFYPEQIKVVESAENKSLSETAPEATTPPTETTPTEGTAEGYGSQNTIVTKEDYDQAIKNLRNPNIPSGFDFSKLGDLIKAGMYHIEAGSRSFANFSKKMIEQFGQAVKKYLPVVFRRSNTQLQQQAAAPGRTKAPKKAPRPTFDEVRKNIRKDRDDFVKANKTQSPSIIGQYLLSKGYTLGQIKTHLPEYNSYWQKKARELFMDYVKVHQNKIEQRRKEIADFMDKNPTLEYEDIYEQLKDKYSDFELFKAFYEDGASPSLLDETFGTEYRQTIQNLIDSKGYNPDFLRDMDEDIRTRKVEKNLGEAKSIYADLQDFASAEELLDAAAEVLGISGVEEAMKTATDKVRAENKKKADILKAYGKAMKGGFKSEDSELIKNISDILSFSGRMLRMGRGLFMTEKGLADLIIRNLSNITYKKDSNFAKTKKAFRVPEKTQQKIRELVKKYFETKAKLDEAIAQVEDGANAFTDEAFDEFNKARAEHQKASTELKGLVNRLYGSRAPLISRWFTSMTSMALLSFRTIFVGLIGNMEMMLASMPRKTWVGKLLGWTRILANFIVGLPILAKKGTPLAYEATKRGTGVGIDPSIYRKLAFQQGIQQIKDILRKGLTEQTSSERDFLQGYAEIDGVKDFQLGFKMISKMIKNIAGKEKMTDEEFGAAFDKMLIALEEKDASGNPKLAGMHSKGYYAAAALLRGFFGSIPTITGRAIALSGDRVFYQYGYYEFLAAYANSKGITDPAEVKRFIALNSVGDSEAARAAERAANKRIFAQNNAIVRFFGSTKAKLDQLEQNIYGAKIKKKVQGKGIQAAVTGLGAYPIVAAKIALNAFSPFVTIPSNVVSKYLRIGVPVFPLVMAVRTQMQLNSRMNEYQKNYSLKDNAEMSETTKKKMEADRVALFEQQRLAAQYWTEFFQGAQLAGLSYLLVSTGSVGAPYGDDDESKKRARAAGIAQQDAGKLNLSHLFDVVTGKETRGRVAKKGDITIDYRNLGMAGFSISTWASAGAYLKTEQLKNKKLMGADEDVIGMVNAHLITESLKNGVTQLGFIQNISNFISGIKSEKGTEALTSSLLTTVLTVPTLSYGVFSPFERIEGIGSDPLRGYHPDLESSDVFMGEVGARVWTKLTARSPLFGFGLRKEDGTFAAPLKTLGFTPSQFYRPQIGPHGERLYKKSTFWDTRSGSTVDKFLAFAQASLDPLNMSDYEGFVSQVKPFDMKKEYKKGDFIEWNNNIWVVLKDKIKGKSPKDAKIRVAGETSLDEDYFLVDEKTKFFDANQWRRDKEGTRKTQLLFDFVNEYEKATGDRKEYGLFSKLYTDPVKFKDEDGEFAVYIPMEEQRKLSILRGEAMARSWDSDEVQNRLDIIQKTAEDENISDADWKNSTKELFLDYMKGAMDENQNRSGGLIDRVNEAIKGVEESPEYAAIVRDGIVRSVKEGLLTEAEFDRLAKHTVAGNFIASMDKSKLKFRK